MKNRLQRYRIFKRQLSTAALTILLIASLLLPLLCVSKSYTATRLSLNDYRNFYAIEWRGTSSDNLKYAKQMGYRYVAHQSNTQQYNPDAKNMKFYIVNPELDVSPVKIEMDLTKTYSSEQKTLHEKYLVWKNSAIPFPHNIATGWWYNDHTFLVVYDFQQQIVIDEMVEAIVNKAKSFENPAINYSFGGLMWDVSDLKGDFWTGPTSSGGQFINLIYWTGKDSCAAVGHMHNYASYSEGRAAFFKKLYKRVREEFPWAKFISEPYILYDRWIKEIEGRSDAEELMPDMLLQESPGTDFVDDSRIFNSGLISRDRVGLTTPSTFGEYENLVYAAKAAINGSWFSWFGRFGGNTDMPNYLNIYEVPARLKLIRMLPNWDNIINVPLTERIWDGNVYKSPNSYADSNIIYSRHPVTGKIFAVFLNSSGNIRLSENEQISSVNRTDGFFIESDDGTNDLQISNGEIRLINPAGLGKGYIISTNRQGIDLTPPSAPSNLKYN